MKDLEKYDAIEREMIQAHFKHLHRIACSKIQEVVATYFQISTENLTSKSRARRYSYPRQIYAYILRELFDISYPKIAKLCGSSDHTTILYSCNKIAALSKTNYEVMSDLAACLQIINEIDLTQLEKLDAKLREVAKLRKNRRRDIFCEDRALVHYHMEGVDYGKAYERRAA